MNWTAVWIRLFGRTSLLGIDMGFWAAMTLVLLIVVLMNVDKGGDRAGYKQRCF